MKTTRQGMLTGMLVLIVALAMAAPASADSFFPGIVPETEWSGSVNGDVYIQYNSTWSTSNPIDYDEAWATFDDIPCDITVKEARLYVVPYMGNQNQTYTGTLYAGWTSNSGTTILSDEEPLNLAYPPPATRPGPTAESPDLLYLNRVTSDYLVVYDVTDLVDSTSATVYLRTTNVSGNFDGRFKEAKLVIAYDVPSEESTGTTHYWVNEGHDPITYYGSGGAGETIFEVPVIGELSSAVLYTDDIASANGAYTWNTQSVVPTTLASNSYARLNQFTLDPEGIEQGDDNVFTYNRVGNYYKLALGILKLQQSP